MSLKPLGKIGISSGLTKVLKNLEISQKRINHTIKTKQKPPRNY